MPKPNLTFWTDLPESYIRETAVAVLLAAETLAGGNVQASRVWPVGDTEDAAAIVYTLQGTSADISGGNGEPQFKTVVTLAVELRLRCRTRAYFDAQMSLGLAQIRNALFGSIALRKAIERYKGYAFVIEFDQEDLTIGTLRLAIDCEFTERFQPALSSPLAGLNLFIDTQNPFDPNGTYTPPFAYYVANAPRSAGPDGRIEIAASIDLNA